MWLKIDHILGITRMEGFLIPNDESKSRHESWRCGKSDHIKKDCHVKINGDDSSLKNVITYFNLEEIIC